VRAYPHAPAALLPTPLAKSPRLTEQDAGWVPQMGWMFQVACGPVGACCEHGNEFVFTQGEGVSFLVQH